MAYMKVNPGSGGGEKKAGILAFGHTPAGSGYVHAWAKLDVKGIDTITFKSWTSSVGAYQGIAASVTDENGNIIGNIAGWTPAASAPIPFDISNYDTVIVKSNIGYNDWDDIVLEFS